MGSGQLSIHTSIQLEASPVEGESLQQKDNRRRKRKGKIKIKKKRKA